MKNVILILSILFFLHFSSILYAQDSANVLEEIPFDYVTRSPVYDFSEKHLNNTDTIPDFETMTNKLKITGTIFESDGITPAKDVILFIEQPNEDGEYDLKHKDDKRYVYHRAWVKTDADGKYVLYTFIPGSYRHSRELRHIHPIVKEAGKTEYKLDSFMFEDDPFLTKACKKRLKKKGVNSVLSTLKKEDMYVANYNIILQ
ncbi:hypothetical protein OS188_14250 [Xanthomarina sp. F1114]|uniref:hypothetical protein n=1 Tax=Xanthomarina sp. F1114 TaxID=2996019 RepID=UPI00225E0BB1|nr:hypothetical protein [Xanthomarina sp. F1114]MCX7549115.1 hypothetical protein [Xanthomarina sp. F1114]